MNYKNETSNLKNENVPENDNSIKVSLLNE